MRSKHAISLLLLTAIVAALASSAPSAISQSLTTVTTLGVTTTSVSVPPTYGQYACVYEYARFPMSKGAQVNSVIDSSSSIDFHFMTNAQLSAWIDDTSCDVNSALVSVQEITHYSLSFTVSDDGTYGYLFLNKDPSNPASVTFTYPTEVTSTLTVTPTLLNLALGGVGMLIIIAVAIVVIALVAYFVGVRRGKAPASVSPAQPAAVMQPTSGQQASKFCVNCGASLPTQARFCNSCGTQQP